MFDVRPQDLQTLNPQQPQRPYAAELERDTLDREREGETRCD